MVTLDAAALVEQYAVSASDTLLILDDDTPYEERLHLVLVRKNRILDHVEIGSMYTSGIFKEVAVSNDTLQFRFESDAVWSVAIDGDGKRGFGGLPRGSRRRGGFFARRYLKLEHGSAL